MSITTQPGATFTAVAEGLAQGLGSSITFGVAHLPDGVLVVPETSAAITEYPQGDGTSNYAATRTMPSDATVGGLYATAWPDALVDTQEEIIVESAASAPSAQDLVSLDEVKLDLDITDSTQDAQLTQIIEDVSDVIRGHCERNFATAEVTSTRVMPYDGSGFLEVPDIALGSITALAVDGVPLPAGAYSAEPLEGPVVTWIELSTAGGISPAMGFEYGLDKYVFSARRWHTVSITATFGWPEVPRAVRRAALWTIQDWLSSPDGDVSESIDGYSHSRNPSSSSEAIPKRAQKALERYTRVRV